jgi:hypothetical protein
MTTRTRFVLAFGGIVAACGGFGTSPDTQLVDAGPDAAAEADTDAPPVTEGGAPDTGPGLAPGASVACGDDAGTCAAPDICCVRKLLADVCEKTPTACNSQYSAPVACDEPADCIGGAICCALIPNNRDLSSVSCQPSCPPTDSYVVCTTTSSAVCGTKRCVKFAEAIGGPDPVPDPSLFVCEH